MASVEAGNEAWQIETHGIDVIPDEEKNGKPIDLFWVWFAANIGILGVVYGGIIVSFHLSFLQAALAAALGSLSFVLVGILSVAGRDGAAPMLTLSRAVFGVGGNIFPTLVSWINLLGWESVTIVTGTLTVAALLQTIFGLGASSGLSIVSMVIFGVLVMALGLLGHATLIVVQKYATWIFGILTLIVVIFLLANTDWHAVLNLPSGHWASGFLPALSIIIAGTGLGWVNSAADYSRYQSRKSRSSGIISMTTFGAAIPLFLLMMVGVLLTTRVPDLASAANPIAAIGHALPEWMMIPYLIMAAGGMIVYADLNMYSSGLNLLTVGIRIQRHKGVIIDAIVMTLVTIYVLFIQKNFLGPFQSFLSLTGVVLAAWVAVFMVDQWLVRSRVGYGSEALYDASHGGLGFRGGFNVPALICWIAGIVTGFLFTASPLIHGPFAKGLLSDLSLELTFLVSGILYAIVLYVRRSEIRRSIQSAPTVQ